jgi:hypothetical protein
VTPSLVVPDTDVILQFAFGPPIEPRGPDASRLFELCRDRGIRVFVLPGVEREIRAKLSLLDQIYSILQEAQQFLGDSPPGTPDSSQLETVFLELEAKAPPRTRRIVDMLSYSAAQMRNLVPEASTESILALSLLEIEDLRAVAEERVRALALESLGSGEDGLPPEDPILAGLGTQDALNIRSAESLGLRFDQHVVFVTEDGDLRSRKKPIEVANPHVTVTSTAFAPSYLG